MDEGAGPAVEYALMTHFDILLQTCGQLHADGEPSDYVSAFTGIIRATGDDATPCRVGKVRAWRINADVASANGEPLLDVCDAHSAELHAVHTLLYESDQYHFRQELIE